jgi:hypothetical protein
VKIENKIFIGRHGEMQMLDMRHLLRETRLPLGSQPKNKKNVFHREREMLWDADARYAASPVEDWWKCHALVIIE